MRFASNGPIKPNYIHVKTGEGVRYTVPQRIDANNLPKDGLRVFFRVCGVMKPAAWSVTSGCRTIKRRRKAIKAPGELEEIELTCGQLAELSSDMEISVRGDAAI